MSKVCFVISPIGDEGSDVRRHADDLYELVIRVALEPFRFDVVRADKLPGSGQITSEVIDLVQSSELCVIDLTGLNANVFYECGRRHETGKPFVQLLLRGERLPFDLAGIRTISFSLDSARDVHEAVEELRRYTNEFERTGYGPAQSGASFSTLAATLDRVERKLDRVAVAGPTVAEQELSGSSSLSELLEDPRVVLTQSLAAGNLEAAQRALGRVRELLGPSPDLVGAASILSSAGKEDGARVLEEVLQAHYQTLETDILQSALASWERFYMLTDREGEVLSRARELIGNILEGRSLADRDKGYYLNQLQRILYGAGEWDEALQVIQQVIELVPEHSSYWYNLSLIHEKRERMDLAADAVDEYLRLDPDDSDDDHLSQAIEVYVAQNRLAEAQRLFARLEEVAAPRAAVLMFDPSIRKAVRGSVPGD